MKLLFFNLKLKLFVGYLLVIYVNYMISVRLYLKYKINLHVKNYSLHTKKKRLNNFKHMSKY